MERPSALPPRFRDPRPLGVGARGRVLLVSDETRGGDDVALKIFHRKNEEVRNRFPALRAAAARSPAFGARLVRLFDWVEGDEWHGFTMATCDGEPLVQALRGPEEEAPVRLVLGQRIESPRFHAPSAHLVAKTRRVFAGLAAAVGSLHDAGFVHGDLRPENVLVDADGAAVLLDLDAARAAGSLPSDDGLVATTWAAPELGQDDGSFGPPCDVYSLGTLLFLVLTGDVPFAGSAHDVVLRKGTVSAPRASFLVPGIPPDLDDLCARMLDRNPARRATLAEAVAVAESGPVI